MEFPKPKLSDYPAGMFDGCSRRLLEAMGFTDLPPEPPPNAGDLRARRAARALMDAFGGKLAVDLPPDSVTPALLDHRDGWYHVTFEAYARLLAGTEEYLDDWDRSERLLARWRAAAWKLSAQEIEAVNQLPAWRRYPTIGNLIAALAGVP